MEQLRKGHFLSPGDPGGMSHVCLHLLFVLVSPWCKDTAPDLAPAHLWHAENARRRAELSFSPPRARLMLTERTAFI